MYASVLMTFSSISAFSAAASFRLLHSASSVSASASQCGAGSRPCSSCKQVIQVGK